MLKLPKVNDSRFILPIMKSIKNVTRWRPKRVCQSWLRLIVLLVLFMLVTACSPPGAVFAIDETGEVKAQLGFRGQAKLGSWIPMRVETPDRLEPKKFKLKLVDGDDTPITYVGNLHSVGTELNQHQGFAKIGRGYGNAQLQLLDIHDNVVEGFGVGIALNVACSGCTTKGSE